jgi:hypothetical protein
MKGAAVPRLPAAKYALGTMVVSAAKVPVRQPYIRRQLSRLEKPGLTERQERRFKIASIVVVLFFAFGWTYAIAVSVETGQPAGVLGRMTANPLDADGAPEAAFLFDAALNGFAATLDRGQSGAVNVVIQESGDSLPWSRVAAGGRRGGPRAHRQYDAWQSGRRPRRLERAAAGGRREHASTQSQHRAARADVDEARRHHRRVPHRRMAG